MKKDLLALLETIRSEKSGSTLANYEPVHYAAGFQYSKTENGDNNSTADVMTAAAMIERFRGTCGIWYEGGYFYVETSFHEMSREKAIAEARKYHQLSVYDWKNDTYINL